MIFEYTMTETSAVKIRVRAKNKEESDEILEDFRKHDSEGDTYLADELNLNGIKTWTFSAPKEIHPSWYDEAATISRNEDGTFEAVYEGGDEQ